MSPLASERLRTSREAVSLAWRRVVPVKSSQSPSLFIRRDSDYICWCFYAPRLFARRRWISTDVCPHNVALLAGYGLTLSLTLQPNTVQSLSRKAVGSSSPTRCLCVLSALHQQRQGFGRREGMTSPDPLVPSLKAHSGLGRQQLIEAAPTARCEKPGGGQSTS